LNKLDHFLNGQSIVIESRLQKQDDSSKRRFLVKKGTSYYSIQVNDIAYFFKDELLFLVDKKGQKYIMDTTLDELSKRLDPELFFRLNRQLIVSFESIKNLKPASSNRLEIQLSPEFDQPVYVSQNKVSALKDWLSN
jgi:two-component system LytT family response regulator